MQTSRRKFLKSTLVLSGAVAFPWKNILAHDPNQPHQLPTGDHIRTVRGNVGSAQGYGGSMGWYLDKEALVIVDTQDAKSSQNMLAELKKHTDRSVDFVINTHHHWDHINGNKAFQEGGAKTLVAHQNCADFIRNQRKDLWAPTVEYTDYLKLRAGKETLSLYNFGTGHTFGDTIVHFENANVVHAGDLVWHRRGPFVDHGGGCRVKKWVKVLAKMEEQFDKETLFIFGHANKAENTVGPRSFVTEFKNYYEHLISSLEKLHRQGRSIEEILKEPALVAFPNWPHSERTIKELYKEVSGEIV